MIIQEALKETGKACRFGWDTDRYIHEVEGQLLNVEGSKFANACLLESDWQPYHEAKEIRPEKAGELWDLRGSKFFTVSGIGLNLRILSQGNDVLDIEDHVIHGKNGWVRLCPSVDEKVVDASLWGKGQTQKDEFKKAQVYANEMLRQALELAKEMKENIPSASIPEQLAASSLRGVSVGVSIEKELYVERIEIDRVEWAEDDGVMYPRGGFKDWKSLQGRQPMKMILLIPKEQHERQS